MQSTHRSGPLKQKNKSHHTLGHKSNRQIKHKLGGKTGSLQSLVKKNKLVEWRHERKNREKDLKKQKRLNVFNSKRSLGQLYNAPFIVTILYFGNEPVNRIKVILNLLTTCDENAELHYTSTGNIILNCSRFKLRYQFVLPNQDDRFECMDAAKITDVLLCVYDANEENKINELKNDQNNVLNAIYHHCLPTSVHVINGLNQIDSKKHANLKKSLQKQLDSWFLEEKLHFLDSTQDAIQLLNIIGNCKKKSIAYRERRSQLFVDRFELVDINDETDLGVLRAYGYVRNKNLDVNKLIHIPGGSDDYKIEKIQVLSDPYKTNKSKEQDDSPLQVYVRHPDLCQPLYSELIADTSYHYFNEDQELPTAEDIARAEEEHLKMKKLVPKGTSEYQAAWLIDSDDDEDYDENEDASSMEDMENCNENYEMDDNESIKSNDCEKEDDADMESLAATEQENDDQNYDKRVDFNEEMTTLARIQEERKHEMFPDEIDTPINMPAKIRFAKYRGLASFHKTKWDRNENLPFDYTRTFEFQHFKRSRNLAFQGAELADGASAGQYVMIEIANFRREVYQKYVDEKKTFVIYQLLKHEQKMSVFNVVFKKHPSYNLPIKSKEPLIFHVGCRRYTVCPIFLLHSNGDKHKYEKFLKSDTQMVATFYAPITFDPCSVSVYKRLEDNRQVLVATGSILNVMSNRIVVKRLVLSGHPFKIHKTFSVIRYMFYNRDDILWFKPIELRTKYGRKGTIKEPLGTHGHMKCVFDKPIKSNDTVLMNLYKRVFPKWTYEPVLEYDLKCESREPDEFMENWP